MSENTPWLTGGGTASQPGSASRLSTLEEQPETPTRARTEARDLSPLPASAFLLSKEKESLPRAEDLAPHAPTTHQRLEFFRYLVQRGIVNEGWERPGEKPTPSES
jgi:hypothetical protein